jgi:16S rRNA (cytosine967-C5)-methyltransferase
VSSNVTPAREIAYDAFIEVMEHGARPEAVLEKAWVTHAKTMKRIDRNLVKEIVYGGLRWYSKILWILQNTASRDLNKVSPQVRAALILGTYQIFYLDRVPDRAAVNESVEYIRKKGQASAVSFVNGILRQIARRAEYFAKPDKQTQQAQYLALQFAFPLWMVERWLREFSFERLEVILAAMNQVPPNTVRINTRLTPVTEISSFQQQLLRDERTHTERGNLRCTLSFKESPNLEPESIFSRGLYTIQDEAAQLIAFLVDPKPDQIIFDAAAGPGGKISHMFELADGKAVLTGVEKNPPKAQMARDTLNRLGHGSREGEIPVTWVEQDFLDWKPKALADKILCDIPCSGLGVLRRHPEGKWHKKPELIQVMAEQQRAFIKHALSLLKPGGELIYSVCSFEREETEDQLTWIKREYGDKVEVQSPVARLPDYFKRYVTRENVLLIYPGNQDSMDGFGAFIVKRLS